MLNLFDTLDRIYTAKDLNWVNDVDPALSPVVINLMLFNNYKISHIVSKLNKHTFRMEIKDYCVLAWSMIQPKLSQAPFCKSIKKLDEEESRYDFLLDKIRDKLEISGNDWKCCKHYFLQDVKNNTKEYLVAYGVVKKEWSKLGENFEDSKEMCVTEVVQGLGKWF